METGDGSITSATVMPSRRSVKAVLTTALRAAEAMNQPMSAHHSPLMPAPSIARQIPNAMSA